MIVVQVKLDFEGPIRYPTAAPEQSNRLVQEFFKGPRCPFSLISCCYHVMPYTPFPWPRGSV
jgi:hypothetical protein